VPMGVDRERKRETLVCYACVGAVRFASQSRGRPLRSPEELPCRFP
jgi:hypothetical protein